MTHRIRPRRLGDQHLVLGDQRPGDAGAQQVIAFIRRLGPQHGVAIFLGKPRAQVLDDHLIESVPLA